MNKLDYLAKNKIVYVYDSFEEAVFKFTELGKENFCSVKFKGVKPYKVGCTTNLAMEAYLGGKIISKEKYEKY